MVGVVIRRKLGTGAEKGLRGGEAREVSEDERK